MLHEICEKRDIIHTLTEADRQKQKQRQKQRLTETERDRERGWERERGREGERVLLTSCLLGASVPPPPHPS